MPNLPVSGRPADHVDDWPDGPARSPEGAYAAAVGRALADAVGGRSLREVGEVCGLAHTTVSAVLRGERWPDLVTLARLEAGLGVRLWPDR